MPKVYITGDTHIPIHINKLMSDNFPEGENLTAEDFVIVAGDFGLIWHYMGESDTEKEWKARLNESPWTTLFIDGNHENFARLNAYPVEEWHGGKVHKISDKIIHLMRGQIYDIAGKTIFTFGGGQSIDRGYAAGTAETDRGIIWWEEELPTLDEMGEGRINLNLHGNSVDYIITHDLPEKELVCLGIKQHRFYRSCYLNTYLEDLRRDTEFRHWYSGHYHEDITVSPTQTILFNEIVELGEML